MQNILFVCIHNSNRSQMAEAFFNSQVAERGIEAHADSAGTRGAGALNHLTVRAMQELGMDMDGQIPKQLKPEMIAKASHIVAMGSGVTSDGCPTKFVPSETWSVDDPSGLSFSDFRRVRDEIRAKVGSMVETLEMGSALA